MTDLEKAQEYFSNDRFATENGAIIREIGSNYAVCTLTLTDRHRNALGNVMGGVLFMLADFAFAVATNWGHSPTVSTDSTIHFLRASKGAEITARAEIVKAGRTSVYCEVSVTDDQGKLLARVSASGAVLPA